MFKDLKVFSLPELEEQVLKFWEEHQIFKRSVENRGTRNVKLEAQNKGKIASSNTSRNDGQGKTFRFFEGPPTANGRPGLHHVLARSFKDIILRYKTMRGYYVPRRAGWDTHGLPVEIEIEKELGIKTKSEIEKFGIAKFNERAKASVLKYKDEWERLTSRTGMWLDFANPYITYANPYVESLWNVFAQIAKKKLLTKAYKIVPWCPRCETSLSSHELAQPGAYKLTKDPSVFVKFEIRNPKSETNPKNKNSKTPNPYNLSPKTYFLVWTTTPWTLPSNVAIALDSKLTYTQYRVGEELLWSYNVPPTVDGVVPEVVKQMSGRKLVGLQYEALYPIAIASSGTPRNDGSNGISRNDKKKNFYTVLPADFIDTTTGTGMVHIAPAFGEDDYQLTVKAWKLGPEDIPVTINEAGMVIGELPGKGKFIKSADKEILADLERRGLVYSVSTIEHDYPFCWRCSTPLLYFARSSWFITMSKLRNQLLAENKKINWIPNHIQDGRFGEWLREVKDWAISRARYWGTPLPIWECEKCNATQVVGSLADLDKYAYKPNEFFIMRHGEATHNISETLAGGTETVASRSRLTKVGITQVEATAKAFQKLKKKIDVIVVSSYFRAQQTARIVAKILGVKQVVVDTRLGEIYSGVFDGGPVQKYMDFIGGDPHSDFMKAPPKGESLSQCQERMVRAVMDINRQYEGKHLLIIGHGDPLWVLEGAMRGLPIADYATINYIQPGTLRSLTVHNYPYNDKGELDLHRPYVDRVYLQCKKCRGKMTRVKEVADVWFDSGAMPYAQWHYPFENKEKIDVLRRACLPDRQAQDKISLKRDFSAEAYPADYIAEGMDQTRGWFYTLLAEAVALGRSTPYLNVISFGLLLDKNGMKMSKSKGNVIDPWAMFSKYGADAVRWHFYTMNPPGEPKRFDENDLTKVTRRLFAILYNSFVFLNTYGKPLATSHLSLVKNAHVLDRWILAKLIVLINDVTTKLDAYDVQEAGRLIELFVDDLSRWYIRRSRRRFQRPEPADLAVASATLRFVLLELAKLMAPFTPFFAEALYQSIMKTKNHENKKSSDQGGCDSVHLEDWAVITTDNLHLTTDDKDLLQGMEEVRRLAALGLAARAEAGIKVRQPLAALKVRNLKLETRNELLEVLKDEVNVKEVVFNSKLEKDVELDVTITPELREEGLVREFVRLVQDLRQEAGYKPGELAILSLEVSTDLGVILERHVKVLQGDTSMRSIEFKHSATFDAEIKTDFDGVSIWVGVRKPK